MNVLPSANPRLEAPPRLLASCTHPLRRARVSLGLYSNLSALSPEPHSARGTWMSSWVRARPGVSRVSPADSDRQHVHARPSARTEKAMARRLPLGAMILAATLFLAACGGSD